MGDDQSAELLSLHDEIAEFRTAQPWPPGKPLMVHVSEGTTALQIRAKSLGTKREPSGSYVLRARLLQLTNESKNWLAARLS